MLVSLQAAYGADKSLSETLYFPLRGPSGHLTSGQ
jgi:hypothetical protein